MSSQEVVEAIMDRPNDLVEMIFVLAETLFVILAAARKMRRNLRIGDFVFAAGYDPHPRSAKLLYRGKQDDVIDADQIRADFLEEMGKIFLGPHGGIDDGVPTVAHVVVDLLVRRLVEIRDVSIDEVLPVLGHLFGGHGWGHVDDVLSESVAGVDSLHIRSREKDGFVAESLTGLCDANGVQCRSVSRLRKER